MEFHGIGVAAPIGNEPVQNYSRFISSCYIPLIHFRITLNTLTY